MSSASSASPARQPVLDRAVLVQLGLREGEPVRFRREGRSRWHEGRMAGISSDGSITLFDTDGSARNLRPEAVEVRRPASKGRLRWQLVSDVAVTWEQLALF